MAGVNRGPVLITVEHPKPCMTCDEMVEFGEQAWWVQGVGIWHKDCKTPVSLNAYVREYGRLNP